MLRPLILLVTLLINAIHVIAGADFIDSTTVYIQALDSVSPARPLAEIKYNPSTLEAELADFFAPDLSPESKAVRIGVYDAATSTWKSSTSVASASNFAKGYVPTVVLSLDAQGAVLGVTCKSSKIDAGQTRDFSPKIKVLKTAKGKLPELNRPVVLSPEGKLAEPEPEKTLLQKYWWVLLGGVMLLMTAGGSE